MEFDGDYWVTSAAGPYFGENLGKVRVKVHSPELCVGRACVVHAPSGHPMRDWPTHFRSDKYSTDRICPHGVGHPDPDDLAYQTSVGRKWVGIHSCDGCCLNDEH